MSIHHKLKHRLLWWNHQNVGTCFWHDLNQDWSLNKVIQSESYLDFSWNSLDVCTNHQWTMYAINISIAFNHFVWFVWRISNKHGAANELVRSILIYWNITHPCLIYHLPLPFDLKRNAIWFRFTHTRTHMHVHAKHLLNCKIFV